MSNFISFVDSYAVNALWQVPLVGAAGWAVSWLLKRLGPQAQHVVWVATLLLAVLTPAVPRWHWHASAREGMLARMEEERALAAVPPISHPAVVAPVNSVPFSVVPSDASLPDVSVAPRRSLAARPRMDRSVAASTPPVLDGSVPLDFAVAGPAVPFVVPAPAADAGGVAMLPAAVVFALLLCYLAVLLYFALRFAWSLYRVAMLHREAEPLCFDAESEAVWARCREMFVLGEVRTLLSQGIVGPVTVGFVKPLLLVPVRFVERCSVHDLLATLGHECAHIRRRDFQKNLIYEAASLLIAFHPVTWLLKRQIAQTREMVCDGRAVEQLIDVQHYVQALLRLAAAISGGAMGASSPAIGIFDGNILERRILMMKAKRQRVSTVRRCGLVLAGAAVLAGVVTAGSARAVAVEAKAPVTAKAAGASTFAQVTKMFQAVTGRKPGQRNNANMAGAVLKATPAADQINLFAATPAELKDHRLWVIFFDLSSMQPADINRAVDATKDFINNHMQPADLVGMISLSGGLSMDQDFTSDKDLLRKALGKYDGMASGGQRNEQSTGRSLDAIRRIATSLEKIDQKKSMLYFSGGLTRQGIENDPGMRAATNEAVKANMYIYAVDARGLKAMPPLPQAAVSPQAVPGESSDAINVSWVQLQELNPDVPPSQQKSAVLQLDGKTISIPGFMVPLADGVTSVNEFLLIPYRGASIHVPPPPPNQMVYVKMNGDASLPVTTDPILVTGRFKISTVISPYGDLSYVMTGMTVKPYTSPDAIAPQNQLNGTYKKWVDEDVRWIISDQEMAAFAALSSDEERDQFIQNFWQRRNPTPDSKVNPYREEYYQRIAFANQHYAYGSVPGWKSDRGMIYIKFGKPDTVDSHPAEGQYTRPAQEGGGTTATYPFEVWHYRSLAGIGDNIDIEFVDTCRCGEYHATVDRSEKNALKQSKESDRLETFAMVMAPPAPQAAAPTQVQPNQVPIPGHPDLKAGPEISNFKTGRIEVISLPAIGVAYHFLSDTPGVDFSAYMRRLHDDIERNWYPLIPEEVQAPHSAKGITGIRFIILPNGDIGGVKLETPSGDTALDKAAWSAIVSEGKFQPLPKEFHGPNIELRCGFYYNIEPPQAAVASVPGQVRTVAVAYSPQAAAPTIGPVRVSSDVIKAMCVSCPSPAYPRDARQAHVQGEVLMHAILSKDGSVKDLQMISGPELLRDATMDAVRTWKYKPYLQGGEPVEVDTTVMVNFSMNGWHIVPSCDPNKSDCGI